MKQAVLAFTLILVTSFSYGQEVKKSYNLKASGVYFRESVDVGWKVRMICNITSMAGIMAVIHDENAEIIYKGVVPRGKYTDEKPYLISIPKDKKTGDYKLVFLGHEKELRSINMPVTTLSKEVYGGTSFAVESTVPQTKVFFQVPEKVTLRMGGYKGHMAVSDKKGNLLFDTEKIGKGEGRGYVEKSQASWYYRMNVDLEPGNVYGIVRKSCFYFQSDKKIFLTFDPERWFFPSLKLQEVNWWENVK
ncbi:MAG: hypothetical protein ACYTFY_13960 [Planctomycetota bacterium]